MESKSKAFLNWIMEIVLYMITDNEQLKQHQMANVFQEAFSSRQLSLPFLPVTYTHYLEAIGLEWGPCQLCPLACGVNTASDLANLSAKSFCKTNFKETSWVTRSCTPHPQLFETGMSGIMLKG